jgi:hypothetical protein
MPIEITLMPCASGGTMLLVGVDLRRVGDAEHLRDVGP